MPTTHFTVTLTELASGATRMVIEARFPSTEAMEQLLAMGMEEVKLRPSARSTPSWPQPERLAAASGGRDGR
jgi:hypothetical protein